MKDMRKKLISVLQIVISLALLTYIVWKNDLQEILNTLQAIDLRWYLPAFILFQLTIVLRAYRWYLLVHTLDDRPSFLYLVYLYFVGFFANNFIPSGFGGDVVKIATLRQSTGKGAEAASSVVMERATGLLGSTLVAIVALLWNHYSPDHVIDLPQGLWLLIVAISAAIPLCFLSLRLFNPFAWLSGPNSRTTSRPS